MTCVRTLSRLTPSDLEHAGGDALALADEAEQQVLGADVVVVEPARLVDRQLDDLLGARRQADVAGDGAIAAADDELDRAADLVELDAQVAEHLRRDAFALADQAEQQVLGADVVVVEALRLFLRKLQDFARPLGEFVEAISHVRFHSVSATEPATRGASRRQHLARPTAERLRV